MGSAVCIFRQIVAQTEPYVEFVATRFSDHQCKQFLPFYLSFINKYGEAIQINAILILVSQNECVSVTALLVFFSRMMHNCVFFYTDGTH